MRITSTDLQSLPHRKRVTLVNCLSGFKSANLVGTCGPDGQTNVAIISSAFHLGADPALVGFISRPDSVARHTLENIRATGHYTLNHVHAGMIAPAHQTSARYPKETSEFDATGLTVSFDGLIAAPYVAESKVRLGISLRQLLPLEINGTVMVIGEVSEVFVPEGAIADDGFIDLVELGAVSVSGLDCYHPVERGKRYAYAKPDIDPTELD